MHELIWPAAFFTIVAMIAYAMFPRRGEHLDVFDDGAIRPRETPETLTRKFSE